MQIVTHANIKQTVIYIYKKKNPFTNAQQKKITNMVSQFR